MIMTSDQLATHVETIRSHRTAEGPFDVAITGTTRPQHDTDVREYEAAGATWWLEHVHGLLGPVDDSMRHIAAGPPRASLPS